MKKLIVMMAWVTIISNNLRGEKFEFQKSPGLPDIEIKVTTQNKETGTRKLSANNAGPVTIDLLDGDAIAVLTIAKKCKRQNVFCEEFDEIYIAYPKPGELKSHETNTSERGTYIEKIKRYDEPRLRGKTKFTVSNGYGITGFFTVDALD